MPLMGKDTEIESYPWLREVGLTGDQFAHVWTYTEGEPAPGAGEYRNIATGDRLTLGDGEAFPEGRWVSATAVPAPRFKIGTDAADVQGPPPKS